MPTLYSQSAIVECNKRKLVKLCNKIYKNDFQSFTQCEIKSFKSRYMH